MTNEPVLQLSGRYLEKVRAILCQHLPDAEVWAYGSRVNGDCFEASDLDLVARFPESVGKSDAFSLLSETREAFIESDLPIIVQIVDWDAIPQSFRDEILNGYAVIR